MKKKAVKTIAALLTGMIALTACQAAAPSEPAATEPAAQQAQASEEAEAAEPAQESGDKVTVTFWDENAGDDRTEYYRELIAMFEEENPNIHIEYLGLSQSDALSKYQTAIQADETPDVGGLIDDWAGGIVQQNVCVPLDDYFAASGLDQTYTKNILDTCKTYNADGKIYFLSITSNFNGFWVNNDRLAEAGLSGAPKDWNEFFDVYCPALTDESKGEYAFAIRGGSGSPSELMNLMYSYSGIHGIFDENGKCTVNDPKHVEFLHRLKDIYGVYTAESDITSGYKELVAAFDSGAAAMIYHNLGSYNTHKDAFGNTTSFTYCEYPRSETGEYVYDASGTTGYVMFNTCEHPDEAWAWINFMLSHQGNSFWNEHIGQIPVNNEALGDEWLNDAPHIKAALETINSDYAVGFVKPEFLPGYSGINSTYLEPAVQSYLSGDITPEELLDEWAAYYQEEYDAYQQ